jgi:hypothetical protein
MKSGQRTIVVLLLSLAAACGDGIIFRSTNGGGDTTSTSDPNTPNNASGDVSADADGGTPSIKFDSGSSFLPADATPLPQDDAAPAPQQDAASLCTENDYPAGPYGSKQGSIMRNHTFQGWADGDTSQLKQWGLDRYYCMTRTGEAKALLINVSSATCSTCKSEQSTLRSYYADAKARGIQIAEILWYFDSQQEALNWVQQAQLQFSIGFDFDMTLMGEYDIGSVPLNLLIDLKSMKIVWVGNDLNTSSINQMVNGF